MVTPARPVRVAILDDYDIVVAGVAKLLEPYRHLVTVVELDTNLPVVSDVDVVLYDTFAQAQGADINLNNLTRFHPAKTVVYSFNIDANLVRVTLDRGVAGYVSKGVDGASLARAIAQVHAGLVVTPRADGQPDGDANGSWPGHDFGLTAREAEVLALICQGLSNHEIAASVFIGINTVKTYIRTLYAKIGVTSRSKAILWGVQHGFTPDRTRHLT